jgi:putative DNA primase/helicase
LLAFWTNRDAARIDRLFRRSALMRSKWGDKRGNTTWGAQLIAKAIAKTPKGYTESTPQITIQKASDVPDERLVKVFGGRLVCGSFVLVCGPGDAGKGMLAVMVIAYLTTGAAFPGETTGRAPMNVMVCVVEDSMGRVKSRLRAAGADLTRVYFVSGPTMTRGGLTMPSPMMLDDDAGALVQHAKAIAANAIFLETTVEHFGDREGKASRRSTHNEADVRHALSPFRALCAHAGLFGFGAIHPRKSAQGSIDDSISGSAAFRSVSRAVLHVYRDPEDESDSPVRLFPASKANYLRKLPPTLRFRVESWDEDRGIPCGCATEECGHEGRVVWDDELVDERTAETIWQQLAERNKPRNDFAVQEAEDMLGRVLVPNKVVPLDEIFGAAKEEHISPAAVKRAKERLKAESVKGGFPAKVLGWRRKDTGDEM